MYEVIEEVVTLPDRYILIQRNGEYGIQYHVPYCTEKLTCKKGRGAKNPMVTERLDFEKHASC